MVVLKKATNSYIASEEKEFLGKELTEKFSTPKKQLCGYESANVELLCSSNYEEWIDGAFYACFATWDMQPAEPVTKMMERYPFARKEAMVIKMLKQRPISAALESATFTFKMSGVPRTFLAQITRHRQMSFGVQSLRVNSCYANPVRCPQVLLEGTDQEMIGEYEAVVKQCRAMYKKLINEGVPMEQARSIMPMGTTTTMATVMRLREVLAYCRDRTSAITQDEHSYVVAKLAKCMKENATRFYDNFIKNDHIEELIKRYEV